MRQGQGLTTLYIAQVIYSSVVVRPRMSAVYPAEFTFFPRTWVFQRDINDFQRHTSELNKKHAARKTYIVKPVNDSTQRERLDTFYYINMTQMRENCVIYLPEIRYISRDRGWIHFIIGYEVVLSVK